MNDRREQLVEGLAAIHGRIAAACRVADRDPATVTLVVVTKTYPVTDIALLASLGVHDVGESRDQEAAAKTAELAALELHWHFIGRLQSNKAQQVAGYADLVHSLDRSSLIVPLARGAAAAGRRLACLLQVSLDGDPSRGGCPPAQLLELAAAVAAQPTLAVRGIMAVAPMTADPLQAFSLLPGLSRSLAREYAGADLISAGMSGDLEAAVAHGATHLRVGSAVLGARAVLG